jgi:branched-chain amino acid transport system substrate-binding protein
MWSRFKNNIILLLLLSIIIIAVLATAIGCSGKTVTSTAPGTTVTQSTTVTSTGAGTTVTQSTTVTSTVASTTKTTTKPPKDKIVIGAARPLSGPLNFFEETAFGPVYKMWVDKVNADGGLFIKEYNKKLPIELKVYDDTSDMNTMTRLLEKLMVEDKVDFVFPPASTAFLFAAGSIANKYGYIMLGAEGGCTTLEQQGLPGMPYFFGVLNYSNRNQIPVLADMLAAQGVKTAAIIYIADLHGVEYSGQAGIDFDRVGIKIVMTKSSIPYTTDVDLLLKEARDSGADVVCCFVYPPTTFFMVTRSIALGYSPKAMVLGPGGYSPVLRDQFVGNGGRALDGVLGEGAWSPKSSTGARVFFDEFVAKWGEGSIDYWGSLFYWGGLQFFQQAVEKAGTLNQETIRQVMATSKFDTALGPTWFDQVGDGGCLLALECQPGQIGQWQWSAPARQAIWEVVGPVEKATAPMIYPKPAWVTE